MESFVKLTGEIAGFLWGLPLALLICGTGLYLTIGLRGIQFRKTIYAFKILFKGKQEAEDKGDITPLQALTTALAATVGTGNIAGVATAIAAGGPGALFWYWVMGCISMATKFAEIFLAMKYREVGPDGKMCGGPMYYIEKGLGNKFLAVTFAIFCLAGSLGPGNMVQSHSIAVASQNLFGLPPYITGLISATLVALVILGGIVRIGKVTEKIVPIMALLYLGGGLIILITNYDRLFDAIHLVVHSALNPTAAVGGFLGATVAQAFRYGIARATFSNESGLGSAPIAHAAAITHLPGRQALIGMIGVFIDTLIICTITGLVIVVTGVWDSGLTAVNLTTHAFSVGLPVPVVGKWIVSVGLLMFAFSTFIGWSYYGLQCVEYLMGIKAALAYRWVFVIVVFLSANMKVDLIWNIVDILVALMAIPNILALWGLSRIIFHSAKTDPDLL